MIGDRIELAQTVVPIERCPSCKGVRFPPLAMREPLPRCACQERDVRGFAITSLRYSERKDLNTMSMVLSVAMEVRHRETGVPGPVLAREHVPLSAWARMDDKQRADVARWAVLKALEHELDECFHAAGVRVFDPHRDELPEIMRGVK